MGALAQPEAAVDLRQWTFAGPVARSYEVSRAPVAMIVGPVGGGKSTASARRCLRVASWQHPSPRDQVRRARIVCVCPTYRRAWDTVIPSFFKVFKKREGDNFRGSRGDPADFVDQFDIRRGGETLKLHVEVLFRAVQEMDIEEFLRGFEFTALWLPEADTNSDLDQLISLGMTRVGRYPEPEDRPLHQEEDTYAGIFGDANAPIIGSAFHRRFYLKRMPDGERAPAQDQLWRQPGGFSANAENMDALRRIRKGFYEYMLIHTERHDRGRMIDAKPGLGRAGQPVHPNFNDEKHVAARSLEPDPGLPVEIGVDCGSNALIPGATFSQRGYNGQWRTFAEIWLEQGQMNTEDLGREIVAILNRRFPHRRPDVGATLHLDPAAGGGRANSQFTTAQLLQGYTQIEAMLAPSNVPKYRRQALDRLFLRDVAGGEPAYVIDPDCTGLTQGLAGGFHYPRRGSNVSDRPDKGRFSHVVEADEYAKLSVDGMDPDEERFIRRDGEGPQSDPRVILP